MKKKIVVLGFCVAICCAAWALIARTNRAENPAVPITQVINDATPETFNKSKYSLTDPTSPWVIVNKNNPIALEFIPELTVPQVQLRLNKNEEQMQINTQTAPAIKDMFEAAKEEKINLVFGSGYRSAAKQKEFYDSYSLRYGQASADTFSARPGFSEHQTGFAVDITSESGTCHLQECWQDTPEGKWTAANAYKFGFILRYLPGKQEITGYSYEPWHFRYVGKELANKLRMSGETMEEFFNYKPAPSYD